ncbi:MAG: histidinol-phosphate transaminase [Myxococcales bacterium]|nr:histidinol-phosphate transaminase [Myxococcales bacterium]
MSRYWSPVVASLKPYVPGEQPRAPGLVKLNTNENPFPPSPRAIEAIRQAADAALRLYPDPSAEPLRAALAEELGVQPAQVFVGNGSDEVLAITFQALLRHDAPLLFPDVTYSFYPSFCALYGVPFEEVPVDAGWHLRVDDYHPSRRSGGAVIFANPNAPTGLLLPLGEVERLLGQDADRVVVVDEAYIDFGGESAVSLVDRYPNLLVVQTLSKSRSLAGLRVGFAVGDVGLIEALERVKNSFNSYPLDRLSIAGAVAAVEDRAYFERTRAAVIEGRVALTDALEGLGFEVVPSAANFVFARHPDHDSGEVAAALRRRNVLVRHFRAPRVERFLRITVGTEAQHLALLEALREVLAP